MKCPYCKKGELTPAKVSGFCTCPDCGFLFKDNVNEDPSLNLYKYDVDTIRSKDAEPKLVFAKAENKFNNGKYEVVGLRIVRGDYSLLFGQLYLVLKRKHK